MSDDTSPQDPQDASQIWIGDDREVRNWTEKWGVSREELREAVEKVGARASAVAI